MLISAIFKAISFYVLYKVIKKVIEVTSNDNRVKKAQSNYYSQNNHDQYGHGTKTHPNHKENQKSDIVDVEYRVIK